MCTMGTFGQLTGGGIAAGIVAFLKSYKIKITWKKKIANVLHKHIDDVIFLTKLQELGFF